MELHFADLIPSGIFKNHFITEYGEVYLKNGEITKPIKTGSGLLKVRKSLRGKSMDEYIHVLVALTFIVNKKNLPYVVHIDGNKQNNHKDNLTWSAFPEIDNEDFKTIPGYSHYKIAKDSTIKSYKFKHAPKIMKSRVNEGGYLTINLVDDEGKQKSLFVHRLVATTYIPNPQNYPEVDHIDRNRKNNCCSNLRWADKFKQCQNKVHTSGLKPIKQFSLEGEFISEHKSSSEAVKKIGLCVKPAALKKCANLNEKELKFTSAGYMWQFVREKTQKYILQKGEVAVKTVGVFGDIKIDFPDYKITNFGNLIDKKGFKAVCSESTVCPSYNLKNSRLGLHKKIQVHVLVALFFVKGRTKTKCKVDHLDENRRNPRFDNLEWVTSKENSLRAGHKHSKAVNKIDPKTNIILASFKSLTEAAANTNLAKIYGISRCCRGISKTSFGFKWEYK